jgi:hypothetical protein
MTYSSLVPDYIVEFHRALLEALRVDYFRPGMGEMNNWRDFLGVMKPLDDSVGGPFTKADLAAAVALMRSQNRDGSNWSLRFAKIMQTPEAFRDLVLIARKEKRERPAKRTVQAKTGDGAAVAVERDPAAEAEPQPISDTLRRFMEQLAERKKRRVKQ